MSMIVSLCLLVAAGTLARAEPYCPSPTRSSPAKLSLLNFRNPAGQWTSQLNFTRDTQDDASVWDVDLVQDKLSCADGRELVSVLLTLTLMPVEAVPTSTPPQKTVVKPGYQEVPGVGIFKLHVNAKTWTEARDVCYKEGTHLAVINSDAEATYFKNVLAKHATFTGSTDDKYVFLGFEYSSEQKKFITIQGTELTDTGYAGWGPGRPNSPGQFGDTCGGMNRNGKLYNVRCSAVLSFFCEQ